MTVLDNGRTTVPQGFTLWLMGPTSSGKTTLAELLSARLHDESVTTLHYDGDEIRDWFGENHGFTPADRLRVVGTLVDLANKATAAGINVIVSALTANEGARKLVHEKVSGLVVGYVKCSIEVCAERDPKGLYAMAQNGEIETLIGINSEYHPPENPDLTIDTVALSPDQAIDSIVAYLHQAGHLN